MKITDSKENILKVACFCENWGSGGIESFLTNILESMDMEDLEIDLIVNQKEPSIFDERLQQCQVNIIVLSKKKELFLKNHLRFIDWIRKNNYQAIHLNIFHGFSLIYLVYGYFLKIPIRIAHSHNNALRKSSTKWIKILIHRVSKQLFQDFATTKWACSQTAGEFLYKKGDFQVINNGIPVDSYVYDEEKRKNLRNTLEIENKLVLGHVGRLVYQKNQDFLLDILIYIKQQGHPVALLLIGEGEDRAYLEEKAKENDIQKDVIFYHTSDQIQALLSTMDVFVFPSIFEAFGITMIEAQANGLPVVCSTAIPIESRISSEITVLSLTDSVEVWAEKILSHQRTRNPNEVLKELTDKGYGIHQVTYEIKKSYLGERSGLYQSEN